VLLSCPGLLLAQTASARPASAAIQRSGVVAVVDTASTPALASVDGRYQAWGVHPSRCRCPGSGCPVRPVSSPSGVRSPGVVLQGPAVCCPPVQRPAVCCPPLSVRTRPPRPTSGRGVGDQAHAAGNRHHRVGVDVPMGGRAVGWLGRRPSKPGGRRCRGRAVGQSGCRWPTRAGLGAGGRVPAERPGGPGRRAERRWLATRGHGNRLAVRGGRACRIAADQCWVGDHGAWSSWSLPLGRRGPERADGRADGDRCAAPARPRLAAAAPGSLPTAL
jgi:hypothetical protein